MPAEIVLQFVPEIHLQAEEPDQFALEWRGSRIALKSVTPGCLTALRRLAGTGATEAELERSVRTEDGSEAVTLLFYDLERWRRHRMIRYAVPGPEGALLTLTPLTPAFRFKEIPVDQVARFTLSRFAYERRHGASLVLESPLAPGRVQLGGPRAQALLAALATPAGRDAVANAAGVTVETAALCLSLLTATHLVTEVKPDGATVEDEDQALAQWEFQDLLFHARTRGRSDTLKAATFRFAGRIDPLPVVKPPASDAAIPLYRPDLDRLKVGDVPFSSVLEERRSVRQFGDRPVTDRQLGEFLFRAARVQETHTPFPDQSPDFQVSRRPYPSGGACHELELYLSVSRCEGLEAGLYHYDPLGHRLVPVSGLTADVEAMLKMAASATGQKVAPPVLITIAARFPRVMWKYERLAYSLILKNVGGLCQTMHLVATAMNLDGCILGGGDADLFSRAAGTPYYAESSVGEFVLGSKA